MSKCAYDASIARKDDWAWNGDVTPPDANVPVGQVPPLGQKPLYIFKRGDTLVLRVNQERGPHKIELSSTPYSARTPFAYPFDLHSFTYNPDDPEHPDILICAGPELLGSHVKWDFNITSPGGVKIDPEFQVGVGGHPPAQPENTR